MKWIYWKRKEYYISILKYTPTLPKQIELAEEELSRGELSKDGRLALILLRESRVVDLTEVDKYRVSEGIDKAFDIENVMRQDMVDLSRDRNI